MCKIDREIVTISERPDSFAAALWIASLNGGGWMDRQQLKIAFINSQILTNVPWKLQ
jgi:hypothetical protein